MSNKFLNLQTKGKKTYGLIVPKKKKSKFTTGLARHSAFASSGPSGGKKEVESSLRQLAAKNTNLRQTQKLHQAALEEDSTIFDYDGVYDDMQAARQEQLNARRSASARKSRYIGELKRKAVIRERYQDRVYERMVQKEQAKDDALFGDKERFVTSAYKAKLAEDKRWEEEERRRAEIEAREDVTKKKDLSSFYRNLLNDNLALGPLEIKSDKPKGDKEKQKPNPETGAPSAKPQAEDQPVGDKRGRVDDVATNNQDGASPSAAAAATSSDSKPPEAPPGAIAPKKRRVDAPATIMPEPGARLTSGDAIAAAKARALARRKAKKQSGI